MHHSPLPPLLSGSRSIYVGRSYLGGIRGSTRFGMMRPLENPHLARSDLLGRLERPAARGL